MINAQAGMKKIAGSLKTGAVALALLMAAAEAQAVENGASACPALTWTTLGTAGGPVPAQDRAEPSNLLRAGNRLLLVDTGDGTVNQLARIGLTLGQISDIFISHHHLDHTGGLAAVIGLRWMNSFPGQLTVYGPPGTDELVAGITASMRPQARVGFGIGAAIVPPEKSVRVIEISDGERIDLGALSVRAIANTHFDKAGHGGAPDAISLSYRFDLGNRSITYSGDTGPSDALTNLAAGSNLLVTEIMDLGALVAEIRAQRPDMPRPVREQLELHLSTHHLTAQQVGQMAKAAEVKQLLLTHYAIPGPLSANAQALLEGIRARYSGPVNFGRDLSSIDIGCP